MTLASLQERSLGCLQTPKPSNIVNELEIVYLYRRQFIIYVVLHCCSSVDTIFTFHYAFQRTCIPTTTTTTPAPTTPTPTTPAPKTPAPTTPAPTEAPAPAPAPTTHHHHHHHHHHQDHHASHLQAVLLKNGKSAIMSELKIGDQVQTGTDFIQYLLIHNLVQSMVRQINCTQVH